SWSPRAGFNWDLSSEGPRQQVRGGIGLFSGRNPFVYLSNQYGNTGIEFRRITETFGATKNLAFSADPDNQPKNVGTAATNEIDVVDPDYQFPSIVRGNLAYDRDLFAGVVGNFEVLFSNTVNDVNYSNLNLVQTGTRLDGRPVYGRVNSAFSDVILLRNTDQGDNWMVTGQLERRFRSGWFARGAYSYGRSNTISDTTNSTARSTWLNVYTPGNVNDAPLAVSNFDLRHRLVLSGSYAFDVKTANVLLSMFYSGQTGRPYSYNFGLDANSDGSTTNDLLFYPTQDQVNIITSGFTYQDLVNFVEGGDCDGLSPGSIVERNSCRMPFTHSLDFRAAVNVAIGRFRPEFTVDVINLLNLFDSELGQVEYTPFSDILVTTTNPTGVLVESAGKYNYNLSNITRGVQTRFSRDDLRSRWQAQIGMRVRF
ncbi:MAG TPA: hypothetical protein VM819_18130, partial [Vicinamibacterales bacterium]|nr:hypothetical protein [Vicinamibacterales bacterium]